MFSCRHLTLAALFVLLLPAADARAGRYDDLLEALIRKPLRATDSLPVDGPLLRHVDASKFASPMKRSDEELLRQFDRLEGVNNEFRTTFSKLSETEQNALVDLVSAGQRVSRGRTPQESVNLIRKLDGDGLIQGRTYGDFVYEGVDRMGPEYKSVVAKMGDGAGVFFHKVIEPHWGKWTAAGLTAAYLSQPEIFHDALGQLTEYAVQKLLEAGIRIGESATSGFKQAIIARVRENPGAALLVLAIGLTVVVLQIGAVRTRLVRGLQRIFASRFSNGNHSVQTSRAKNVHSDFQE